ncbi:MAG: DUF805 domain-containing protein, partial [Lentisphaeria bacterium]|nr:DUF805 domain-containing protein [Lentisphaeria bacterium]
MLKSQKQSALSTRNNSGIAPSQTSIWTTFRKCGDYRGIASRKEFWHFTLFITILNLSIFTGVVLLEVYTKIMELTVIPGLVFLLTVFPWAAVTVRRLHDAGKKEYEIFWCFLPLTICILLQNWLNLLLVTLKHETLPIIITSLLAGGGFLLNTIGIIRVLVLCSRPSVPQPETQQSEKETLPDQGKNVNCFTAFRNFADFRGCAGRKEYWSFLIFSVLVSQIITGLFVGSLIPLIWVAVLSIPGLSLFVRRLHDIGKSGLHILWCSLPISVVAFIMEVNSYLMMQCETQDSIHTYLQQHLTLSFIFLTLLIICAPFNLIVGI